MGNAANRTGEGSLRRGSPIGDPLVLCEWRVNNPARMNLAILFWFHEGVEVCVDRLRLLRAYNADTPIYGLYVGSHHQAEDFESDLSPYLNDFYEVHSAADNEWKSRNCDLMIAEWYRERGQFLDWNTIVVVQSNTLVFGNVSELFSELNENEILLSGLRPVGEVAAWENWTAEEEQRYLEFLDQVKQAYNYESQPLCDPFIFACI